MVHFKLFLAINRKGLLKIASIYKRVKEQQVDQVIKVDFFAHLTD